MIITQRIPVGRFEQFHKILIATNGRYLSNPQLDLLNVWVQYEPGNYNEQLRLWALHTTEIRELGRASWPVRLWRRLKGRLPIFS